MALRVLLADESVTIKKVFQLSLKDYGVDVMTVTSGLDVLSVAKKSKPDIVFADVILQKKSGYDVCSEIKNDPELKNTPVVLIWSGFMELDSKRFQTCRADAHLEKPFDTDKLRQLIQKLVPKTGSQKIGGFLQFPRLPDFDDTGSQKPPTPPEESQVLNFTTSPNHRRPTPAAEEETPEASSSWSMENFEPLRIPTGETQISQMPSESTASVPDLDLSDAPDEFVPVDLPPAAPPSKASVIRSGALKTELTDAGNETDESDNQWVQKTLSKYKIPQPESEEPSDIQYIDPHSIVRNRMPSEEPAKEAAPDDEAEVELDIDEPRKAVRSEPAPQLNEKQLEAIIRAQSKEVIEKVVWQVVPEIATQIIEREIQKLLKERNDLGSR